MGDHAIMAGDSKGWRVHDEHLRAMIKLTHETVVTRTAIDKNSREIGASLTRIVESLGLEPSTNATLEASAENTRAVLAAPHNPDMTPAAVRQHHKSVEAIVRLLQKQIEQSERLNKACKGLYRHQFAIMKMFKK